MISLTCSQCEAPMKTPVACGRCGHLHGLPAGADHFALFGLKRSLVPCPATLQSTYLAASRLVHPDFFGNRPKEVQRQASRLSALLNDAYETLKHPLRRAEYVLRLLGGPSSAQERGTPDGFLNRMLALREEAEEGALDPAALNQARADIEAWLSRSLANAHEAMIAASPDLLAGTTRPDPEKLREARIALNACQFLETLRQSLGGAPRLAQSHI